MRIRDTSSHFRAFRCIYSIRTATLGFCRPNAAPPPWEKSSITPRQCVQLPVWGGRFVVGAGKTRGRETDFLTVRSTIDQFRGDIDSSRLKAQAAEIRIRDIRFAIETPPTIMSCADGQLYCFALPLNMRSHKGNIIDSFRFTSKDDFRSEILLWKYEPWITGQVEIEKRAKSKNLLNRYYSS